MQARVEEDTSNAEPGYAVIRVSGLVEPIADLRYYIHIPALERAPYLSPDSETGWSSERTWLAPDAFTAEGDELRIAVGPDVVACMKPAAFELGIIYADLVQPHVLSVRWPATIRPPLGGRGTGREIGQHSRKPPPAKPPIPPPTPMPVPEPIPPPPDPRPDPAPDPPPGPPSAFPLKAIAAIAAAVLLGGLLVWRPPSIWRAHEPTSSPHPSDVDDDDPNITFQRGKELLAREPHDKKTLEAAFLAFRKAANRGHAGAMFELAKMYDPRGFSSATSPLDDPNLEEAYEWYSSAKKGGVPNAVEALSGLEAYVREAAAGGDTTAQRVLERISQP